MWKGSLFECLFCVCDSLCENATVPPHPMRSNVYLLAEEALDETQVGIPRKDSRLGSEMLQRRGEKAGSSGDKKDSKAHNIRRKKGKGAEEKSSSSVVDLAQLFTTTLEGRNTISANDEIDNSGNVVKPEM